MESFEQPSTRAHDRPIEERPYWAEGARLIVRKGATLPERCVRCNAPAEAYFKRTFRWHAPWPYVLILWGFLIYVLVALFGTRRMNLRVPLCAHHAEIFRFGRRLQTVGFFGILVLFPGIILYRHWDLAWPIDLAAVLGTAMLLLLAAMIIGSSMTSTIKADQITATHGRFTAGAAFLASCPDHWWSAEDDGNDSDE